MAERFSRIISSLMIANVILSGCSTIEPNYQIVKHVQNQITQNQFQGPRQLVIFMDGTGNDIADRTNVRRLFEMTSARHRPEVLTYYDPGVGTSKLPISRTLGLALGAGFETNLFEALVFLTENYRENDEISIFGFSRGAYSAALLASIVSGAGLPNFTWQKGESTREAHERALEVVTQHLAEVREAESQAEEYSNNAKIDKSLPPEIRAQLWRKNFWQRLQKSEGWTTTRQRVRPDIAVLGLWDPVNSLVHGFFSKIYYGLGKVAWSVSDISEFERHKGYEYHPYALGEKIKLFLIALSLDEERQPFLPELPDPEWGRPEQYEFVWFIGDHSDVGGGHLGDKDLAGISFNWMLSYTGDRLLGKGGSQIRVYENYLGARHDLYFENGWHSLAFRVRGEILGKYARRIKPLRERRHPLVFKPDAVYIAPLRYEGWTMKIHSSVIRRMNSGTDLFYPPREDQQPVDLARESLPDSDIAKRNPTSRYIPRPFRNRLAAVGAADESWAWQDWTAQTICSCFSIVSTPQSEFMNARDTNECAATTRLTGKKPQGLTKSDCDNLE